MSRWPGLTRWDCSARFVTLPLPQTALILPKRYPLPPIALPGTMKYQEGGVALAASVGQSEEFVALRDYRHGDPYRHIHWRSWAKVGKPVVKEFEDEFFVRHALVLDTFTDHQHSEVFEEAVSVAASFACTIQTQESLLDLLFVGPQSYCFTAGRGLAHADQMLEILASVRACRDQPFRSLEHLVLTHVSSVSGCICVLVAWDEERRKFVEKLLRLGVHGHRGGRHDAAEGGRAAGPAPAGGWRQFLFTKTTMPDYGMLSSGLSSYHPLTRNPWKLDRNPGGSSAGASAAAAALYGPLHLGTDIGGSVRLPAGWCGIFGFKPSAGRIPIDPAYVGRVAGPMHGTSTPPLDDGDAVSAGCSRLFEPQIREA